MATFGFAASAKAHLLFSPGFARRTLQCLVVEAMLVLLVASHLTLRGVANEALAAVELRLLEGAHSVAWWSAVAMLASSCCALQLILSAASLGCSGLNSLLGPVRPPMLAATALLQASAWYVVVARKPQQAATVAIGSAATLTLTLLPELLHVLETRRRVLRPPAAEPPLLLHLRLASVGCTACEVKVRAVAKLCAGVERCDVDLDTSIAKIAIAADADAATVRATLTAALAQAGYEPRVGEAKAVDSRASGAKAAEAKAAAPAVAPPACARPPWWSDERVGAVVGGMAGSSCCALQLCLNLLGSLGVGLFGVGCAGFNTLLGPLRPYTRMATATFFALRWASCPPPRRRSLLRWTALAAALTLLPELLLFTGATAIAPPTDGAVRISLQVEGMGCEACQVAVASALQHSSGVLEAAADFEAGTATLIVQPEWGFNLSALAQAVEGAGFELASAVVHGDTLTATQTSS